MTPETSLVTRTFTLLALGSMVCLPPQPGLPLGGMCLSSLATLLPFTFYLSLLCGSFRVLSSSLCNVLAMFRI